ncbi:hypothetical protein BTVI_95071 [Pitangus sulphuratus]|nr:hypothetical protein BTVI_95071 [Pitangus sulphuratus]
MCFLHQQLLQPFPSTRLVILQDENFSWKHMGSKDLGEVGLLTVDTEEFLLHYFHGMAAELGMFCRNYAKGHLEALIPEKLRRRIDGGFGSAEGHRSNGLPPRQARR